jgi:hypothetical protein
MMCQYLPGENLAYDADDADQKHAKVSNPPGIAVTSMRGNTT